MTENEKTEGITDRIREHLKKISKLTPEQVRLQAEVRDWWIQNSLGGDVDERKITEGVEWIYSLANLKKPKVIIVSGLDDAKKLGKIKESSVGSSVRSSVGWYGSLGWDAGWLAYMDYWERIGILQNDNFRRYRDTVASGIWQIFYFEKTCIVWLKPKCVKKDENGRLHSIDDGAVEWRDGSKLFFIHGVQFEEELWRRVVGKSISGEEIMKLENQEQKSVALRAIGYENVLKELEAEVLDEEKHVSRRGREMIYQLLEADLKDDDRKARFVKVCCPSTEREFVLRVSPTCKTVREGIAWTFREDAITYRPIIET